MLVFSIGMTFWNLRIFFKIFYFPHCENSIPLNRVRSLHHAGQDLA